MEIVNRQDMMACTWLDREAQGISSVVRHCNCNQARTVIDLFRVNVYGHTWLYMFIRGGAKIFRL